MSKLIGIRKDKWDNSSKWVMAHYIVGWLFSGIQFKGIQLRESLCSKWVLCVQLHCHAWWGKDLNAMRWSWGSKRVKAEGKKSSLTCALKLCAECEGSIFAPMQPFHLRPSIMHSSQMKTHLMFSSLQFALLTSWVANRGGKHQFNLEAANVKCFASTNDQLELDMTLK